VVILRPNRLYNLCVYGYLLLYVLSWHAIHAHAIHPHPRIWSSILYHLLLYLLPHHHILSLEDSGLLPQLLHLELLPVIVLPYAHVLPVHGLHMLTELLGLSFELYDVLLIVRALHHLVHDLLLL
jgi:hypothetical protein